MGNTILNIAGGKIKPLNYEEFEPSFLVNVDTMYYNHADPEIVEAEYKSWAGIGNMISNVNEDIFTFMERTIMNFDLVCIYRYLEHVPMDKVLYFIYLLSTVTDRGSTIDVIVPNYETLARMILDEHHFFEENNLAVFPEHNILLSTELLNEPYCPHASIWTPARAKYFFELEGRFNVDNIHKSYTFDGRHIYLRFHAERI